MRWVDAFSTYLYGLSAVVVAIALLILVSGLDDLFIDVTYWVRRLWRALFVYKTHERLRSEDLHHLAEKPLAIMVPAWQETGVIGHMAELAATTLDYENYHIFVGTYPNDPDTQGDVDDVCARFPNVHKVVCARPGPTSKADCLNNVLDAILQFEQRARFAFEGFILHDAEDVVCEHELRLFNYLAGRKDLIQIPVYPFERQWRNFTSLHYLDEFAELHGKDIPVREALAGQVPSAGVGTCFSRRAVLALLEDGKGIAFDAQSLTEDYDIGLRLKERGMAEIFVRFAVPHRPRRSQKQCETNVICVREYFPDRLSTAVRQKSRWIIGIVYQGYRTHGWKCRLALNYFLWRDRKGAINNFVSFAAMLIMLQLAVVALVQLAWLDAPRFVSIFEGQRWFNTVLKANIALMGNRMAQRIIFVSGYYGVKQGLLSIPRLLWGNLVNFLANWRAIRQIVRCGDPRRVAWDKTTHDFPSIGSGNRAQRSLDMALVANGVMSRAQLRAAQRHRIDGLQLGSSMIHQGRITAGQLAVSTAQEIGVGCESVDPVRLPAELLEMVPRHVALHYAVLPLRVENGSLVLASESYIDPVSLAALARQLRRPVRYVIAHKGQVTVGLRRWYVDSCVETCDPYCVLESAAEHGLIKHERLPQLWDAYVSRQVMLGEILVAQGHVDEVAFRALLLNHACSGQRLGDFLLGQGVITPDTLNESLRLQANLQPSIEMVINEEGAMFVPLERAS